MHITYESSAHLFRVELAGPITVADVLAALCAVLGHEKFRPGHSVLWDLRNADMRLLTAHGIRRIADTGQLHCAALGNSRVALLLSPTAHFTVGRMCHMLAGGRESELAVFRHPKEAERWVSRRLVLL